MALKDVFVHTQALVESDQIGPGTRVWAFAHVMKGAQIGAGCNICDHCFIESNAKLGDNVTVKNGVSVWDRVQIEDDVFLGPNAVLTNDLNPRAEVRKPREQWLPTLIRKGATIGANATIVCGVMIGTYAFIGAGSVITRDVPDHALMIGVPGRIRGWMCRCGNHIRLRGSFGACVHCSARYKRFKAGLTEVTASKKAAAAV